MNRRVLPYVLPMVIIWGSLSGIVLGPLARLSVPMVTSLNLVAGILFLSVYLAFAGGLRALGGFSASRWLRLALIGSIGSFLYYAFYFYGLKIGGTDAAVEVTMMNYLFPIMTILFSVILLRERMTALGVLSILISFAGAYVILTKGRVLDLRLHAWEACLCGLGAAVCWGLFTALSRKWDADSVPAIFVYYLTGLALNGLWLVLAPQAMLMPTWGELGRLAYVGAISNGLGVILWFKALKLESATLVGNICYLAAFVSVVVLWLLAGSTIRLPSIVGLGLISVGVLLEGLSGRDGSRSTTVVIRNLPGNPG